MIVPNEPDRTTRNGKIIGAAIALIVLLILIAIGWIVVNQMAQNLPNGLPTNGFTVLEKKQTPDSFLWWHWTDYYFRWGNNSIDWVQVPTYTEYLKYNVGDWCNDTNLWIFNAGYGPDPTYKILPEIAVGCIVVSVIVAIYVCFKKEDSPVTPEVTDHE